MKKALKKKSKRIPTKQRVKAEKKVREHNRKLRKEKRKNPGKFVKASRKNLQVPNECPFKEDVLREVEEMRRKKEEEKERRKARSAAERLGIKSVEEFAQKATNEDDEDEVMEHDEPESTSENRQKKHYYKEYAKVVEASDVILQVLDARDPLGTRSAQVEKAVVECGGKRLVLVLNKSDLVPKENLDNWVKYLRREFPTVIFKSSTQNQTKRLGQSHRKVTSTTSEETLQTSKAVGTQTMMAMLGNYCRIKDIKTAIRVGVVGFPNVGKSSLINSLKRSRVCQTGNTPGVTKTLQEIQLDKKIKLIDSPGMILDTDQGQGGNTLRNAVKIEQMSDLESPVEEILHRCQRDYLQLQYSVPKFDNVTEFLSLVAKANGKLKKGGIPDTQSAVRLILQDWNSGKIKYFTEPPLEESFANNLDQADDKIVHNYAEEFDLKSLDSMMETDRENIPEVTQSQTVKFQPTIKINESGAKRSKQLAKMEERMKTSEAPSKMKKAQKMRAKKEKKEQRRSEKIGNELSDIMNDVSM